MAGYNGSVSWGLQPLDLSGGSAMQDFSFNFRKRYLISANAPMRYEVRVYNAGMTEADEPSKGNFSSNKGDIVNVIFDL